MMTKIYTDGACSGNPGPGGYCAIIINPDGTEFQVVGHENATTNNRMEMLAVIKGLEAAPTAHDVILYSDSEYVIKAFNSGWLAKWEKSNWKTASGSAVKNVDLWMRLKELTSTKNMLYVKVKGHSYDAYNNKCDRLAVAQSKLDNV